VGPENLENQPPPEVYIGIVLFWLMVGDLQAYWMSAAEQAVVTMRELVGPENLENQPPPEVYIGIIAAGITGFAGWVYWLIVAVGLVLGHFLWATGTGVAKRERLGSFSAIRASRTIAAMTLVAAVASSLLPAQVIINVAIALLLTFALSGLSLMLWVTREVPGWILAVMVLIVVLSPLQGLALIAICIAGYVDAWFNLAPERMSAE
ncbi:MAG: hypothetical protein AAAFM81_13690, partial [Pseudomonadota bacterium]